LVAPLPALPTLCSQAASLALSSTPAHLFMFFVHCSRLTCRPHVSTWRRPLTPPPSPTGRPAAEGAPVAAAVAANGDVQVPPTAAASSVAETARPHGGAPAAFSAPPARARQPHEYPSSLVPPRPGRPPPPRRRPHQRRLPRPLPSVFRCGAASRRGAAARASARPGRVGRGGGGRGGGGGTPFPAPRPPRHGNVAARAPVRARGHVEPAGLPGIYASPSAPPP